MMSNSNPPPPCPPTIIQQLPYAYAYAYAPSPSAATSPTPTLSSPSHSANMRYKGTRVRSGKWVSEIRFPGTTKRIWLGTYPTPEMAAAAYDAATLALRGPEAHLNFPNFMLSYPIPASFSDSDIRAAAAVAASFLDHSRITSTPPPAITSSEQNTTAAAAADSYYNYNSSGNGQEGMLGDYFDEDELLNMPSMMPSFSLDDFLDEDIYSDLTPHHTRG